jgi:hypothetical protein
MSEVQPVNEISIKIEYFQMRITELEASKENAAKKREATYNEWKKCDKETLIKRINELAKIHGCSLRDSKRELIFAVVDFTVGDDRMLDRNLRYVREQLEKLTAE